MPKHRKKARLSGRMSTITNNRIQILECIDSHSSISRTQLAEILGLSKASISEHVARLLSQTILEEKGRLSDKSLGRKSINLSLNGSYCFFISIDLSALHPLIVLSNLNNQYINERSIALDADTSLDTRYHAIKKAIEELLRESSVASDKLAILAICAPGYFNPETDTFYADGVFSLWNIEVLAKKLGKEFNCRVYLSNDVNAAAVGEHKHAQLNGRPIKNLIFLRAGWGVGIALIINNSLFIGSEGKAGEISDSFFFMRKHGQSPKSPSCANIQTEASALTIRTLLSAVQEQAPPETRRLLRQNTFAENNLHFSDLINLQRAGDAFINELFLETAELLAALLCNTTQLMNINEVVVAGEYCESDPSFIHNMNKFLDKEGRTAIRLNTSALGKYAGIYGLTVLARKHILEHIIEGTLGQQF